MPSTEPVRVTIFNQSYSLRATDDAGQIQELAQMVDDKMTSISKIQSNLDARTTAVLACLEFADQLRALQQDLDDLRTRVDLKARQFTLLLDGAMSDSAGAGS